jgi:hypothetical protein
MRSLQVGAEFRVGPRETKNPGREAGVFVWRPLPLLRCAGSARRDGLPLLRIRCRALLRRLLTLLLDGPLLLSPLLLRLLGALLLGRTLL